MKQHNCIQNNISPQNATFLHLHQGHIKHFVGFYPRESTSFLIKYGLSIFLIIIQPKNAYACVCSLCLVKRDA